ncbi:MAG TPA: transketolase, partial [Longimicrobiales bacterium]|nr:transketolase [Longimicrobiales bacterium]
GKLVWLFDDNHITIEGSTALSCSTDQAARFRAYGWHVQHVEDGNNLEALDAALRAAREAAGRPSLVVVRTTIAWGSPHKAGTAETHGAPLGPDEVAATKENLGYPEQAPFWIAPEARAEWRKARERGEGLRRAWQERFEAYRREYPDEAEELQRMTGGRLPHGWADYVPALEDTGPMATRAASGKALQGLARGIPELVGGSADLAGSNKTDIEGADDLLAETPGGRILHFGIREHAMGGILNGMSLHGGVRPFGGTFLIFSDYMRPSIRLAALMERPVVYVFTHDSIGLGEDGPTHQPVEHLMALRAIPGLMDLRPADPAETAVAWKVAVEHAGGPAFLALTRQKVPALPRGPEGVASAEGLRRGGYILVEAGTGTPEVILLASGSEVGIALDARDLLEHRGVPTRVVSLPSWYLFGRQEPAYREAVLPPSVEVRVSVEAGATLGWARWTGLHGASVGFDRFGASAPWEDIYRELGITAD